MRLIPASYGISEDGETAIIEMAEASGLQLLSMEERNPLLTTTFGTGELILDALKRHCKHFIIGLGGSATTDGGVGMLQALGMKCYDEHGMLLEVGGGMLSHIASIDISAMHPLLRECRFTLASDVTNPLCGLSGAAQVFGPQKGATSAMVQLLDAGLQHWAAVSGHEAEALLSGAGAAGGLGFAFLAFLRAKMTSGIELLLDYLAFDKLLDQADLVITGEGSADLQTLMGKLPSGILRHAQRTHVPVWLLAGKIEQRDELLRAGFSKVECINPSDMPLIEAMKPEIAKNNLSNTIKRLFATFFNEK
jgi:glycerate kinase